MSALAVRVDGVSNFFRMKSLVVALGHDHGRGHPPPVRVRQSRILAVKLSHVMHVAK